MWKICYFNDCYQYGLMDRDITIPQIVPVLASEGSLKLTSNLFDVTPILCFVFNTSLVSFWCFEMLRPHLVFFCPALEPVIFLRNHGSFY